MKNMYFNLKQLPSKNDGGQSCDGNRQSRVMSQSGCGAVDVPMTLYGASDEHPLSIHSASDGERWKNRGWKYVAMITLLLTLACGQAWGTTQTVGYTTHIVTTSNTGTGRNIKQVTGLTVTALTSSDTYMPAYATGDKDMGNKIYGYNTCQSSRTSRYAMDCYNWKVGTQTGYTATNTFWTGFKVKVASGKKFSLSSANMRLLVNYNHTWRLAIEDSVSGVRLATSSDYTITNYNACITNDSLVMSLSDTTACQDLTGTFYVKMYFAASASASGKYFCFPTLTVTGDLEDAAAPACSWAIHYGTDQEEDWNDECLTQVDATSEWHKEGFVIPDKPNWYIDNGAGNDAKKHLEIWSGLYFALTQGDGSRPMVGAATGAVGTVRIYDNSNWNNRYAGFIPDGYVLKFGSSEKAFAVEAGNEYRSELVEYNSSTADDAVSVGIIDSEGGYVSTDNTQEMRHIFLQDNCNWHGDGAKLAIYYWKDAANGWCGFLGTVPGETNLYEGWIPANYTDLKFVRFSSSKTAVGNWDDKWNETGDLSISSSDNLFTMSAFSSGTWSTYEKKGKFRMNADYTDKNWYVRFYPYHVLTYNANGGSGAPSAQGVPVDGNAAARTVDVAAGSGMTAPTGYEFAGWNPDKSEADAGTIDGDYDPEDEVTMSEDVTLYAVWSPIEYTITLAKGDHGAANQSATVDYDATAVTSITHVTSTGYTLQGYYDGETKVLNADGTFANSTVSGYITSGKWTKASDCELTAKWTVQTYNITYYDGGGSDAITFTGYHMPSYPTTHTYDAATTLKKASKAGYVFGGWFKEYGMSNNTNLSIGATDKTANFNLYAKWTAMSMVDLADGTLYKASNMVPDGLTISSTEYYYPGVSADQRFNLVGSGTPDASGGPMGAKTMSSTEVDDTSFDEYLDFCGTASVTSYVPTSRGIQFKIAGAGKLAIYCKNPKVLYLSNGSSETQLDASETGATKIVKTVSAGTYYLYAKGDGAELYGLQLTNTYTVTYNKNSGSATGTVPSDASSPYDSGSRVVVKGPGDLALEDNIFVGWNDKSDGSGNYYSEKSNFAISENKTLYAQWRDASGTSCPDGSAKGTVFSLSMNNVATADSLYYGDCRELSSYATITNGAASFTNISTEPAVKQKAYITKANPGTLYLNGNDAMITLYLDCALAEGDTIKFTSSADKQLSFTTTPTRATSPATTSKSYVIPAESNLIGKHTIYLWRSSSNTNGIKTITIIRPKAGYTITHNTPTGSGSYTIQVGDGDATSGNTSAQEDDVITLSATPGTGYSFTSWTVTGATSGDDITVSENQFTMPAENVTVDATFTIIDYTVTLNTNSGTINSGNVTSYNYGTGATLPTDVTRSGYRFMGWYADDEFEGDRVYTIANNVTGDKEYWAKWATLYTITKGSPSNGTITVAASAIEGETVEITATPSTGYSFSAWDKAEYAFDIDREYQPYSDQPP